MGIPSIGETPASGQSTFSEDVLKVELCGPKREHLSIIDVPGIFRTPTPGVTTKEDIALVRRIVHSYIKNARTIILAVIPANIDIATQEILTMAEEVDPNGQRTLGVLTKPDLVDNGAEGDVMDLVHGKRNQLLLGYCIVRNRGQRELSEKSSDRHQKEAEFFASSPWANLSKDRVGIFALKERLRELLVDLTRKVFPVVKSELEKKLAAGQKELSALGTSRETPEQQRRYLQGLATEFQRITDSALDARYSRYDLFDEHPELRLATVVMHFCERLRELAKTQGHTVEFLDVPVELPAVAPSSKKKNNRWQDPPVDILILDEERSDDPNAEKLFRFINKLPDPSDYPELVEVLEEEHCLPLPQKDGILRWMKEEFEASRGFELGSFNPAILSTIWKAQSWKWAGLAINHINHIILVVHYFISELLKLLCPDDRVRISLLSYMMDSLCERYLAAVEHVKFIVQVERSGTLYTTDPTFKDHLEKARNNRSAPAPNVPEDFLKNWPSKPAMEQSPAGNTEQTVQDLHDILQAYYSVALKRFVDTVCKQGSDHHLVTGAASPLRVFSPDFVSGLTPEQLEWIAGEELTSRRRRQALTQEIALLKEGKKILAV